MMNTVDWNGDAVEFYLDHPRPGNRHPVRRWRPRGTGRWTFEKLAEGTRACYRIDLEPQGWLPRLLSNWMDFGKMHSRSMVKVFDGLESWLKATRCGEESQP